MGDDKKNAIFMMCIINPHYVLGACIASYCHRRLLESSGRKKDVDLVIMCDDKIYDTYHELLSHPIFFDVVEKIDLRTFPVSTKYKYAKLKYSSWIGSSLNKWQILNHEEYRKIIFVDVALLPVDHTFYDLLNLSTPGFVFRKEKDMLNNRNCKDGTMLKKDVRKDLTYDDYLLNDYSYGSINGYLVVIEPNRELYNEYVKMTDDLYKNGIYSVYRSGPDETSLYYFYLTRFDTMYDICHENANIPWDESVLVDVAKGYEFSAMYKPWIKPKILSWGEEMLWRDIFDIIIKKLYRRYQIHNTDDTDSNKPDPLSVAAATVLKAVFKRTMISTYKLYLGLDKKAQKKNFNTKYVERFSNDFDKIRHIFDPPDKDPLDISDEDDVDNNTNSESEEDSIDSKIFDALMRLDSKIYIKTYGYLKVSKLIDVL